MGYYIEVVREGLTRNSTEGVAHMDIVGFVLADVSTPKGRKVREAALKDQRKVVDALGFAIGKALAGGASAEAVAGDVAVVNEQARLLNALEAIAASQAAE